MDTKRGTSKTYQMWWLFNTKNKATILLLFSLKHSNKGSTLPTLCHTALQCIIGVYVNVAILKCNVTSVTTLFCGTQDPSGGQWSLQRCLASDRELKAGHPAIQSCCHSGEGGRAAKNFLNSGVTSENRKKSISDPDQLRLCVTCVCLRGRGRAEISEVVL